MNAATTTRCTYAYPSYVSRLCNDFKIISIEVVPHVQALLQCGWKLLNKAEDMMQLLGNKQGIIAFGCAIVKDMACTWIPFSYKLASSSWHDCCQVSGHAELALA